MAPEGDPRKIAEVEAEAAPDSSGPCFDRLFFLTVFSERVKDLCNSTTADVPIVLLDLIDGTTLDLCHVEGLAPRWMAAAVFRSNPSCDDMDLVFVPYESLIRVTVAKRSAESRPLGFNLKKSLPALSRPADVEQTT